MVVRALFLLLLGLAAFAGLRLWQVLDFRVRIAAAPPEQAVIDPPGADLTVVLFYDYACPYCRQAYVTLAAAAQADGRVRVVARPVLTQDPEARQAARLFLAAGAQGREEAAALHDVLVRTGPPRTPDAVVSAARAAGLDLDHLADTLDIGDAGMEAELARASALAATLDKAGRVPLFVLGGGLTYVPEGRMPQEADFARMFALARGRGAWYKPPLLRTASGRGGTVDAQR